MSEYLLLLVPKEPELTNSQLKTIVDICVSIGSISLGSVVIPVIFDRGSLIAILTGLAGTVVFWYTAVKISRRINE